MKDVKHMVEPELPRSTGCAKDSIQILHGSEVK